MVNERGRDVRGGETGPVTMFGPDFPFGFDDWISHPAGLGRSRPDVMAKRSLLSARASPGWSLRTS